MTTNEKMAALKALSPWRCSLEFSDFTGQWFLSASIGVCDGMFEEGITEHRFTPIDAIEAFWRHVTEIDNKHYLSVYRGDRARWNGRWNGYMWAERIEGKVTA